MFQEPNLSLEIYKEGITDIKAVVQGKLKLKQEFIESKYKEEGNLKLLPKLQAEEEFIKDVKTLIKLQEEVNKELRTLLQKSKEAQIRLSKVNSILKSESQEYMNKYYDLMLKK